MGVADPIIQTSSTRHLPGLGVGSGLPRNLSVSQGDAACLPRKAEYQTSISRTVKLFGPLGHFRRSRDLEISESKGSAGLADWICLSFVVDLSS